MATLRLKPFVRLSKSAIPQCAVSRGCLGFSTLSLHKLKHPAPAPPSSRFLPRFLDPSIYWNVSSRSRWALKYKGPKENKPWNPATFYVVRHLLLPAAITWQNGIWDARRLISRLAQVIFLLIGSQAIQVITLKLDHEDRMRRANVKIAVLKEVIDRLHRGEEVDVEAMLGTGNEKDEKSWEEVLKEIEEEDAIWQAKARKKQQKQAPTGNGENTDLAVIEPFEGGKGKLDRSGHQTARPTRQPRSARDYGFS